MRKKTTSWQPLPTAVYCQSMNAGCSPGIMNMLGGFTSPWLNVCGLEESSSCTHANESTMALPILYASSGSPGPIASPAPRARHFFSKMVQ